MKQRLFYVKKQYVTVDHKTIRVKVIRVNFSKLRFIHHLKAELIFPLMHGLL